MHFEFKNDGTYIYAPENFSLAATLDCGQAFRWREIEGGIWEGIALDRYLKLKQTEDYICLFGVGEKEFYEFWYTYFDLERDYGEIIEKIENPTLKKAAEYGGGIRILRQDPWEALCSFIISQNNNIPRIKGIINRLCENFGEKIEGGYSFPSAKRIAQLTIDDLSVLRSGFRAKYIMDAARKVALGELNLEALKHIHCEEAREKLLSIYGVGNKVADCVLLFGLNHLSAFPRDVWIKRAISEMFGGELREAESEFAGVYQQYIFYYARENNEN